MAGDDPDKELRPLPGPGLKNGDFQVSGKC